MSRTVRIYRIDQMLHERHVVSFEALREALEVSPATLKRDLQCMRDEMNSPIIWDPELRGYRFDRQSVGPRYELPGLWFHPDEIHALLTMQHLLANLDEGGILTPHVKPLMARLNAMLGEADNEADEVRRRVLIVGMGKRAIRLSQFEKVGSALLRRRRLRIDYAGRGRGETTGRIVSPQRLVFYRDNWYLDAWCHLREDLRSFAVDAILGAEPLEEAAREVGQELLTEALGPGYGILRGRELHWARLRFTPERARWVASEQWHAGQKASFEADGSFLLEVPYADDRELLMDVLRYGADVEVLEPASLRQRVAREVGRMAATYAADPQA